MSLTISIEQASTQLQGLVRALGPHDVIVLTDNDVTIARIIPMGSRVKRTPGTCQGMLTIVSEDDEHLEDFKDYMPG